MVSAAGTAALERFRVVFFKPPTKISLRRQEGFLVSACPVILRRHYIGFTLIELVVVIAIVGALAALAIPRFINLRQDSYKAAVATAAGQYQSAVHMSNQLCIVRGWAGRDNIPGLGTGNVDFNANCYPSDTANSNVLPANAARCMRVFQGVMNTGYTVNTSTASNPDFLAAVSGGNCRFTFRRDTTTVRRFDYGAATGLVINVVNP
jgi:MSHA pilin protein MshB